MDAETDTGRWMELDTQLHMSLYRAAGSPRLVTMISGVQDVATLYVAHSLTTSPDRIADGNREHRDLIEALRAGDGDRAATVLVEHLESTLRTVLATHARAQAG